ncbi:ankyrin repeat domain-containing protein 53 [Chelonia mydas]|uniref:ankyrin repeat domain-containing protein 53 n=1 Tax=Chelonia mydas TaxID=8469 RepID=UPI0018A1F977|nr:ankyrin repeat domain-containing protein 53 [Chelonia mydas]
MTHTAEIKEAFDKDLSKVIKGVPYQDKLIVLGDFNAPGFSAIHLAALYGRLECLKLIVEKFEVDVNLASLTGWTPIHLVMNKESGPRALECLQYLIGKGADINVQNQGGTSPLHKAASEGRLDCIIELVEAGADVHAKDAEGQQPIDLCRIWAYRSCARYLNDAMWKTDKRNFAREMHKLNQIKSECQHLEQNFLKIEKREQDLLNAVAFSNWLGTKQQQGLPDSAKRWHFPEDRAKLDAVPKKEVAKIPPGEKKPSVHTKRRAKIKGEPRLSATAQPRTGKSQRAWNASVNPSSPRVTDIFRPTTVRLGTNPEACGDHDFSSFLFLSKDSRGQPVIDMAYKGRLSPVPNLPYEVIEKSLYPHARPIRLKMPQEFKPTHIFDVTRKRRPSLEHRWTDEMAVSLRETLDPAFRATLKAHLSAVNDSS